MRPLLQLVIGTYTEALPHVAGRARGILGASYDTETGLLGPSSVLATAQNPSFIALSAAGDRLYTVNETDSFGAMPGGGVTAFARDLESGKLELLNSCRLSGTEPCHLALGTDERFLLVANYGSGSVSVVALEEDGSLGRESLYVPPTGSSEHPLRQTGPHAHMVCLDRLAGDILVPDLGLDSVLIYELSASGCLTERRDDRIDVAGGTGPRHVAFHPDGQHLFIVGELDNSVLTLRRSGAGFRVTGAYSFVGSARLAAIKVSPSGRHVFVSSRGGDTIAMLAFDRASARLTAAAMESSGGSEPRDLCVAPDGRFLVVANQNSSSLAVLAIDEDEPRMSLLSLVDAPTPACVLFAPAPLR